MTIVTPFLTFPNISWWAAMQNADKVVFDTAANFEKMTFRNRYQIPGANNSILLSVPLANGRNQHVPMNEVRIHNVDKWQTQHWRTLISVYKRSPYFDHYEDSLQPLFETRYEYLIDFNRAGVEWARKQLRMRFEMVETEVFQKEYPAEIMDIRFAKKTKEKNYGEQLPKYYQVFEDRIGFLPDLSILDLLFSEGPLSVNKLIG